MENKQGLGLKMIGELYNTTRLKIGEGYWDVGAIKVE